MVSEKAYKQRIKELCKNRKDKNISAEDRARARLNVLVTNADKEKLPCQVAVELYRLRWQIELEFKSWKTTTRLASLKNTKTARTECYILGRLLWLLLANQTKIFLMHDKEFPKGISIQKFGNIGKINKERIGKLTFESLIGFINSMLEVPINLLRRESKNINKNAEKYLGILDASA